MKEKQRLEAHTIIEYEIKQQILRKEQEDHLNMERFDEEKDKKDFIRHKKLKDLEERKKELILNIDEANEIIEREKYEDKEEKEKEKCLYFGMTPEDAIDLIEHTIRQIEEEISRIQQEELEERNRKKQTKAKEF